MMAFCAGVAVGVAVGVGAGAWYCTALMNQFHHALVLYGATISRIRGRWVIRDVLGTFEGRATEHLIPLMHRYSTTRSITRTTRSIPRSTTQDATEER